MGVLIAYNAPVLPVEHPEADSEREILDVVNALEPHLRQAGLEIIREAVSRDLMAFRDALRACRPDVVLNLFEGFGDDPNSECCFAQLLEDEDVAFTGASSRTLWNAGRKDIAKRLFQEAGLATPAYVVVNEHPLAKCGLQWPVIVKPTFRDASCGIHQASVATGAEALARVVDQTSRKYGFPVLIEEFIEGREISVAVFDWPELTVLPAVETAFIAGDNGWSIVSYDGKWRPGSPDHEAFELRYPADLLPHQAKCVEAMARAAYRVLDCRGFATIDFRLSRDDTLYLLELNPNADLKPSSCLVDSLRSAAIEYTDFLVQMVHSAQQRFIEISTINKSA